MIMTKKLTLLAMGIALFVALSMCLQVPVFENYYLCLGYVVMAVYCYSFGSFSGTIVGFFGVLLYCFCCRQEGSDDFWSIFLALALCMAGDLAINFWFLPGVVLFALAHLNLIRFFLQKQPLRRTTWVWWVLISLMLAAGAISLTQGFPLSARIGAPVYAPILLLTLMCGLNQTGNLKLGAVLLVVSDCALAFYFMKQQYPYVHMAYMALYYLALIIICRALLDERVFIGTPHHMRKQPERFHFTLPWKREKDQRETDEAVSNLGDTLLG